MCIVAACYASDQVLARLAGRASNDDALCVDLSEEVLLEAQVGAVYALYTAYHTQQCQPQTRIYVSPADLEALHTLLPVRSCSVLLRRLD